MNVLVDIKGYDTTLGCTSWAGDPRNADAQVRFISVMNL